MGVRRRSVAVRDRLDLRRRRTSYRELMNIRDFIIAAVIIAAVIFAVIKIARDKQKGKQGCCGDCSVCGGCGREKSR